MMTPIALAFRAMSKAHSQSLIVFVVLLLWGGALHVVATVNGRERLLFDLGWKFHLGDELDLGREHPGIPMGDSPAFNSFNDASWRTVDLPHDWAVELPFDPKADGFRGFKPLGPKFKHNSVAWYRRTFELSEADGNGRLWLEFDGVTHPCTVFVNGINVGRFDRPQAGFRCDITDIAGLTGKNVVAVYVDASGLNSRFYEGAGIYRHVWLVKTAPLSIGPEGISVCSRLADNNPRGGAEIKIRTALTNAQAIPVDATIRWVIVAPNGRTSAVAKANASLAGYAQYLLGHTTTISSPILWSPESPELYRLITTVESGSAITDRADTEFGIRTIVFDHKKGFMLNGRPYQIKGACNRPDHAGLGVALPDRLHYFRVGRLKEMGSNAYRSAYHPPAPELLEACDRLGMLAVVDLYPIDGDARTIEQIEWVVRRARNHPSVIAWYLAHENHSGPLKSTTVRFLRTLHALVKKLDPARPVICSTALCESYGNLTNAGDVCGWHYNLGEAKVDLWHKAHPNWPVVGIEQAGTPSTRGIYANDPKRGHVSAYGDKAPPWGITAGAWLGFLSERPWLTGGFVWSGFDFRGEPTPYWWPCINSQCGAFDICGFPKDTFYFYQAWWSDVHVLRVLPHWNWHGREGQEINVRVYSNCDDVELYLNGQSLGRQKMEKHAHLQWQVKYEPGTLAAIGLKAGRAVGRTKVETTGPPIQVHLRPDRTVINADGEDISVVTVAVTDANLRVVPGSSNIVNFEIEGPGRILCVGNGDPSCHEPDVFVTLPTVISQPVKNWRWAKVQDASKPVMQEIEPLFDDTAWAKFDAEQEWGPLSWGESGVFRARFGVTEHELAHDIVELWFGRIDDECWVYVNGKKVGELHQGRTMAGFDVRGYMIPGTNVVAVAVRNWAGPGGINLGARLRFQDNPTPPRWRRSVFNGLAQIIVQGTRQPGEIKLTAKSEGLQPATVTIRSKACTPRPAVP